MTEVPNTATTALATTREMGLEAQFREKGSISGGGKGDGLHCEGLGPVGGHGEGETRPLVVVVG